MDESGCLSHDSPGLVGDPVDTLTGAVVDRSLDFRLIGPIELRWTRHYDSSQSRRTLSAGLGWAHEFDRSLWVNGDGLLYEEPLRCQVPFPRLHADGASRAGSGFRLRRVSRERYQLFSHAGPSMEFVFRDGAARARLARLFDGAGHEVLFGYGADGRLISITDSAGRRLIAAEDAEGRLMRLSLAPAPTRDERLLIAYHYDRRGNLVGTENDQGHGYIYEYDDCDRLVLRRGRKGFRFYFAYDGHGRCVRSMGDDRLYGVALTYAVPGHFTRVRRPDGGEWAYTFSSKGTLESIRDPLGGIQKFIHDATGRRLLDVDPNGNAATVVYDAAGAAIAKIDALGHRIALPEDPNAPDPFAQRVPINQAEYEYGRLVDVEQIRLPDPAQVQRLPVSDHARAQVVVASAARRLPELPFVVPPLRGLWWPRPKAGRVFTELGKLIEQHDAFGRVRRWTYDESGNVASHVDYDGGRWTHDYGGWHHLRGLTNPLGHACRFSYTEYGKIASFTDAGGTVSEYRYDLKDRLVEVRRHGVVRDIYEKDASGALVAKRTGNGTTLLHLELGRGNRPVKRTLASGDEHTFQYDRSGRPLTASTRADRVEFAYDSLGNCVRDVRGGAGVEHRFVGWRRPVRSVLFERFVISYERRKDAVVLTDPCGHVHTVRLLGNGLIEKRFSNGSSELSQYDNAGRCLFKHAVRRDAAPWSRKYHWSGEGELLRVDESAREDVRCEYDAAHRLRRRTTARRVERFEFDPADNLIEQPEVHIELHDGNRLRAANGYAITYNDRNHIASRQGPNGEVKYSYDSRDQLVHVVTSGGEWTAAYDAVGRRTRKTFNGLTTEYYWNGDQLIAERRWDGRLRIYVYIDPMAFSPMLFVDAADASSPAHGTPFFVFCDQLGTPRLVENEGGTVVWTADVAPFGHAEVGAASTIELNLRFPGHYFDAELGLHYNRFRYYDPRLGRYLQSDPWGVAGGHNVYAYHPNPLLTVDVRGLGEDGDCPPRRSDDDEEGAVTVVPPDGEPLPRLGQQEGQDIVDTIHGALGEGSIAARNSTTTLTETADGTIIITNSDRVTPEMRQTIGEMQEPGAPLDGRTVLVPDDQHNPGYIPAGDRDLPPQGPNNTPTGAENHGEQRGIQAANHYDEHGDANGQGHGPADTQWSSSEAGHGGQACGHCAAAQQQNNVHNPTGVQNP